jgi:hypothetical protein
MLEDIDILPRLIKKPRQNYWVGIDEIKPISAIKNDEHV